MEDVKQASEEWGQGQMLRPRPTENCKDEARDVTRVIKTLYMNACAPAKNLSIPRNPVQYGNHNLSMHYWNVTFNRILKSKQQYPVRGECNVNDMISMITSHEDNLLENRGRGRILRGQGRKFWPRGNIGFEDLTKTVTADGCTNSVQCSWQCACMVMVETGH